MEESQVQTTTETPPSTSQQVDESKKPEGRGRLVVIILVLLLVLAGLIVGAIFLFRQDAEQTGHIRDIFIIFIALETLVIGLALTVLSVQLATLINLLQNEIKPILKTTNDTANTIRGTAEFLSENVTEPVIKLNEYLAGIRKLVDLVFKFGKTE